MNQIKLSHVFIGNVPEFQNHPELSKIAKMEFVPKKYNGMIGDSALYDVVITIVSNVGLGLLSSWIYDKYKENRIKKPMINGTEVDIENITVEEILTIIAKNKRIDDGEDTSE